MALPAMARMSPTRVAHRARPAPLVGTAELSRRRGLDSTLKKQYPTSAMIVPHATAKEHQPPSETWLCIENLVRR